MRPTDRRYTESHEWALAEGDVVTIGITDHAVEELGELVYLDLPEPGRTLARGEAFGEVESVKAVSDLMAPVGGEVVEVNQALVDDLAGLQDAPFTDGWLIKVRPAAGESLDDLLDAAAYDELVRASA